MDADALSSGPAPGVLAPPGPADGTVVADGEPTIWTPPVRDDDLIPWWWPTTNYPGDVAARDALRKVFSFLVVAGCCGFVLWICQPNLILRNTLPTGGDMGAHVWGPAYLRDYLLPHLRLSGWTPDWLGGFPAYTFYMVLPSLAIVILNVGLLPTWAMPIMLVVVAGLGFVVHRRLHGRVVRFLAFTVCVLGFFLSFKIPYDIAFKMVAVSGLVLFPAAIWYLGKGLALRSPMPELMAIASLPFLIDKTLFSIFGGNIASTMAGEFAFSISLTAGIFFLGIAARGMVSGKHRAWGAALLAVTMLCHVIPTIYVVAGTLIMLLLRIRWIEATKSLFRFFGLGRELEATPWPTEAELTGGRVRTNGTDTESAGADTRQGWRGLWGLRATLARWWGRLPQSVRWVVPVGGVGGLIACFWYIPFYGLSAFLDDMGWSKYGLVTDASGVQHPSLHQYMGYLLPFAPHKVGSGATATVKALVGMTTPDEPNMLHGKVFFVLAGIGIVLSLVLAVRAGIFFALFGLAGALGFWLMPQNRFWNARILPLYYLCVYMLAAIGVWLVVRSVYMLIRGSWVHPPTWLAVATIGTAAVVVLAVMLVSIRMMPFGGTVSTDAKGVTTYNWGPLNWGPFAGTALSDAVTVHTKYDGPVRDWVAWNFTGYEGKGAAWTELEGIKNTMTRVGQQDGCGRTYWEYSDDLNRFGSPMALMLLPYWTHSCIGSMEGLYMESSSTTPYHFTVQGELSAACSCAQRWDIFGVDPGTVYKGVQFDLGIQHLQMLGVRYFMASSATIKADAAKDPRLKKLATTGTFDVYQVRNAPLVEGLDALPAVWTNVDNPIHSWAKPAEEWFINPSEWGVYRAESGPASWPRVASGKTPKTVPVTPAKVTDIKATRDTISFDVDKVGTPVLVKSSYFPDWQTSDGAGPYRVAPNLMVVVPRNHHVVLTYGRSPIELGAWALTFVGLALLLWLVRSGDPDTVADPYEYIGDRDDPEPSEDLADDGSGDDRVEEGAEAPADPIPGEPAEPPPGPTTEPDPVAEPVGILDG